MYFTDPCFTGFRGARRDANTGGPDVQQPPADPDIANGGPCLEDEEFFDARPDAAAMEKAIGKFMDCMEEQELGGFKDLHRLLARLPVPSVTASQEMSHKDALEGGFIPSMTEEEQKRFTPSELILYKHALEYRFKLVQFQYIVVQTIINTLHVITYMYVLSLY